MFCWYVLSSTRAKQTFEIVFPPSSHLNTPARSSLRWRAVHFTAFMYFGHKLASTAFCKFCCSHTFPVYYLPTETNCITASVYESITCHICNSWSFSLRKKIRRVTLQAVTKVYLIWKPADTVTRHPGWANAPRSLADFRRPNYVLTHVEAFSMWLWSLERAIIDHARATCIPGCSSAWHNKAGTSIPNTREDHSVFIGITSSDLYSSAQLDLGRLSFQT